MSLGRKVPVATNSGDFNLSMLRYLAVFGAVLFHNQLILGVFGVFLRSVIAVFANRALELD